MKTKWRATAIFDILMDQILIAAGYALSLLWLFGTQIPEHNVTALRDTLPLAAIAGFFLLAVYGSYSDKYRPLRETFVNLAAAVGLLAVGVVAMAFFLRGFAFPRFVLVMAPLLQLVLLFLWHGLCHMQRKKHRGVFSLLVVGEKMVGPALQQKIEQSVLGNRQLKVEKFLESRCIVNANRNESTLLDELNTNESALLDGLNRNGSTLLDDLNRNESTLLDELNTNGIANPYDGILLMPEVSSVLRQAFVRLCAEEGKILLYMPSPEDVLLAGAGLTQFGDRPVMTVLQTLPRQEMQVLKRLLDFVFALFAAVLASPLILAVVLLIKLADKGPLFFTQERVTQGGRIFKLVKFRTMVHGAEEKTGPVLSKKNDPRITKFGRFLRKYRLDELPQLFNILCGHMSLVGPRPERPVFVAQFQKEMPGYALRHRVRAGLTGMAQVYGNYATSAADKLVFDLTYIRDWSLWLDLQIVLRTVTAVFRHEAAEGVDDV